MTTMAGKEAVITVTPRRYSNMIFINRAEVLTRDLSASNGVLHVIGSVLQPFDVISSSFSPNNTVPALNTKKRPSFNFKKKDTKKNNKALKKARKHRNAFRAKKY